MVSVRTWDAPRCTTKSTRALAAPVGCGGSTSGPGSAATTCRSAGSAMPVGPRSSTMTGTSASPRLPRSRPIGLRWRSRSRAGVRRVSAPAFRRSSPCGAAAPVPAPLTARAGLSPQGNPRSGLTGVRGSATPSRRASWRGSVHERDNAGADAHPPEQHADTRVVRPRDEHCDYIAGRDERPVRLTRQRVGVGSWQAEDARGPRGNR